MKSLVFDALAEAEGCLKSPGHWGGGARGLDALVQVDAPAESAGFVHHSLDGLDFFQELAAEEYLLSAKCLSGQDLLDAFVVQPSFYGFC